MLLTKNVNSSWVKGGTTPSAGDTEHTPLTHLETV